MTEQAQECEWRQAGISLVYTRGCNEGTGHGHDYATVQWFRFCPYCGKPIKKLKEPSGYGAAGKPTP